MPDLIDDVNILLNKAMAVIAKMTVEQQRLEALCEVQETLIDKQTELLALLQANRPA